MNTGGIRIGGTCIILLVLTLFTSIYFINEDSALPEEIDRVTIERRSFDLTIKERGQVRPARVTPVKSEIAGNQAKLIWVLPEGTKVNKGLLIARFDTKPFIDNLQKAEQQLVDSKAQLEVSKKGLELLLEGGKSKKEAAERKLEIAQIKALDLKDGSGPLKRIKLEQIVKKVSRDVEVAREEHNDFLALLEKGHITLRESEKAENALKAAIEGQSVAKAELINFDKYEWPRILREAQVIINAAEQEVERVNRTSLIEQQQQNSKIEKYRRNLQLKERELKKAKSQLAACDIYCPEDGILLYTALPYGDKKRKVQIGDSVWEGQTFLEIPDTNDLIVDLNIREIDVAKLKRGNRAEIVLDAFPGEIFSGSLFAIDSLAHDDNDNKSIKSFSAKVRIDSTNADIYVGMSASVALIYKKMQDVVVVPTNAISYRNNTTFVKQEAESGFIEQAVKLGDAGLRYVHVLQGLNEGDIILVD